MKINLIWAMSSNWVIGKDNRLPWHLPNDLKHFKKTTHGKPVIMGLRTHESIGRPLPGRKNIVLSCERIALAGVQVACSIEEALKLCAQEEEIFVIGGAMVYKQFLPLAHKLYITIIHADVQGDVYFPAFSLDDWMLKESRVGVCDDKNRLKHEFRVYESKK
jgi:dihydrofolate reductase